MRRERAAYGTVEAVKVYDVVQVVGPETISSYLPGRWWCCCFDRIESATAYADRANECTGDPAIRYFVEEHDELSTKRAPEGGRF